jgi:periplasmic copper chaperone A
MLLNRRSGLLLLALTPGFLLTACGREPVLRVKDAVVKLSPVEQNPSAMYFTVYGGPSDTNLIAVSSRSAIRVEKRGGKHAMLFGINLPARRLQEIEMEFVFANGSRILVETPIEALADTAEHESH